MVNSVAQGTLAPRGMKPLNQPLPANGYAIATLPLEKGKGMYKLVTPVCEW